MQQPAESAVEAAIYQLGNSLFAKIVNPLVIIFVAFSIGLFLWVVFQTIIKRDKGLKNVQGLWYPVLGLTIMLSALGITYFIGNTGNDIFQGGNGGPATQGIGSVVKSLNIR